MSVRLDIASIPSGQFTNMSTIQTTTDVHIISIDTLELGIFEFLEAGSFNDLIPSLPLFS